MNKYGQAAIRAVELIQLKITESPKDAWEMATIEIFGKGTSSQVKGCPKNTFLSLCETGQIKGVGIGNYTKSEKNKSYAIRALDLITENPSLSQDPEHLWHIVQHSLDKKHNSQMNVVAELWNKGFIDNSYVMD